MNIKRFTLIVLLSGIMLGCAAELQAQGRQRPRPVYRPQSAPRTTSVPSYSRGAGYKGFLELGYMGGIGDYRANQLDILTNGWRAVHRVHRRVDVAYASGLGYVACREA